MKKENMAFAASHEPTGCITRSRAAAIHASSGMLPSNLSIKQDQKRILRSNSKRGALDENNSIAPVTACLQHKRRAVLKDVTNICCENSYRNCINASKLKSSGLHNKNSRQGKRGPPKKDLKVGSAGAAKNSEVQEDVNKRTAEMIEKTVTLEPQKVTATEDLEEKVPMQPKMENDTTERGVDNYKLGDQVFGKPSHLLSPSNKDVDKLCVGLGTLSGQDITNIDCDFKDPQMCGLYAPDIYSNLRVAELIRRPCSDFMETLQRDITQSMRGILVDWLVEVSEEYKLVPDTLYLTVYLIDRFLSQNFIERQRLQLLGITCMLIASKYEEICAPRVEEFCFITDNTYTRGEVLKMESQVLNYLGFQLSTPTIKTFLRRFLRAAQASYKVPSLELEFLANYLAELTLVEYAFLKFLPSLIAASAVFLARWTLGQKCHPWNATLEYYTTYKASDMKITVLALQDLQINTKGCPLHAIREKYRQQKFKCVATMSSPKILESLF